MAGDWIKLEHATLDKPEVARLADLLGLTHDAALGLLVRFWVWLDRNSRDGRVTHMYSKPMERVMNCPGFVSAMADIGWLSIDDKTGILTIPNPDRHSFEVAKSRALHRERQRRYRDGNSVPELVPEKRREELNTKSTSAKESVDKSSGPETWAQHWTAQGKALGINPLKGESTKAYCLRVIEASKPSIGKTQ